MTNKVSESVLGPSMPRGGFSLFLYFPYGPMIAIYILSFQGPNGGLTFL